METAVEEVKEAKEPEEADEPGEPEEPEVAVEPPKLEAKTLIPKQIQPKHQIEINLPQPKEVPPVTKTLTFPTQEEPEEPPKLVPHTVKIVQPEPQINLPQPTEPP